MKSFREIDSAIIYGSRALGTYKKGSDIDLVIKGVQANRDTVARLSESLNEKYPLPYFFDIVHYDSIMNEKLTEHIDHNGVKIYEKEAALHRNPQKYYTASDD
ncbi:nucleotidyltransferase family protein [Lentibacillus halodurans]|uniref:nucleotidyltransferase family protein n=1 Tax=Lentibacillus halodurans TaxID=237679 RepID=UPI00244EE9F1|nr:nucleotidyltransferase domain-containing protein [Lentibacillus halodurans]